MTIIPDVLGYKLKDAAEILTANNNHFQTVETFSRKREPITGNLRVIRQVQNDDMIILTICMVPE